MSKIEFYEQIGVAMTCRSFNEYEEMFMLDEHLLKKGRVLDVASGASSFVAELGNRGYDGIAVDPLYRLSTDEMQSLGNQEIEIANQKLDKIKDLLLWESYESLVSHKKIRVNSFQLFLESYKKDYRKEKYISASLPSLPFENDTFSLILCNHFLFLYQEQFDYDFHLRAISELIRIAKKGGVIRIYPLVGFKNEPYPYLDKLIKTLGSDDIEIDITSTDFRFIPTATQFLNIKK